MFVYSVRASTLKFFGAVVLSVAVLVALIIFIPDYGAVGSTEAFSVGKTVSYDKVDTNEKRIEFLSQFGWELEAEPKEEKKVTVPDKFNKVFSGYNEIQKEQGLDLEKYKRKEITRYTYTVTNYPDYDGKVYANLLIYRGKVIGGDICSADINGFVHGFELKKG
ncbi:MAG: DUF4830 domain-containing protein [Ruminococcaceae bacterium]|nr:DUF4830 domain-containing protein [Oscillospiraceae bacterium]